MLVPLLEEQPRDSLCYTVATSAEACQIAHHLGQQQVDEPVSAAFRACGRGVDFIGEQHQRRALVMAWAGAARLPAP